MWRSVCGLRSAVTNARVRLPLQQSVRGVAQKVSGRPDSGVEFLSQPVVVERELPDPLAFKRKNRWYFALFCATMAVSLTAMIKYEDANSPIVTSTIFTLRRSKLAREVIGENIRFRSTMPWISGSAGIAQNNVSFSYIATGSKGIDVRVKFSAERVPRSRRFKVLEWSITPEGGEKIDLMGEDFHPHVPGPKEDPGMTRAR